jgi:hypothetical protein
MISDNKLLNLSINWKIIIKSKQEKWCKRKNLI